MSVYDLQHVTVTERLNGAMYMIVSDEGWYIHLPQHNPYVYKTVVILEAAYDFSTVQIVAEKDLPEDAEIYR